MLGGMPACNGHSVLSVYMRNVRSIAKRLIERMDYPAVDNLDIENFRFAYPALIDRLASFIGMKYNRLYRDFAVADRFDFHFYFVDIRTCPI
jgi:hypothetical protein